MSVSFGSSAAGVERAAQRGMLVLIGAQVVGGMGLASGVAVGALIASDLLRDPAMAGVPFAASIAGTTIAALPLFVYMRRAGRRAGLRLGWLGGAFGSACVVAATIARSVPLLLVGMVLFGCANAASDAARYAAGDLAIRRGRAMGILVFATTLTAIVGPNLLGPAGDAATLAGLPGNVGPFLVSAVAFGGAAFALHRLLRPDPLVVRAWRAVPTAGQGSSAIGVSASVPPPGRISSTGGSAWAVGVATLAMAVANFAMIFAMTAAPAQLGMAGHGLTVIGLIVSLHIGAMFAPSPLSGWLSDRIGPSAVVLIAALAIGASGPLIAASGTSFGGAGHDHLGQVHAMDPTVLTLGLVILGVGWNFAFIGGSALLGEGPASEAQLRAQGVAEVVRGIAALVGALVSGVVLALAGLAGIGVVTLGTAVPLFALATIEPIRRLLGPDGGGRLGDGTLVQRSGRPG
jgi:MFS family permease